jgi:hypothetical protein
MLSDSASKEKYILKIPAQQVEFNYAVGTFSDRASITSKKSGHQVVFQKTKLTNSSNSNEHS